MNREHMITGRRKTFGGFITNIRCWMTGSRGLARLPEIEFCMIASLGMAWLDTHDPEVWDSRLPKIRTATTILRRWF